MSKILPVVLSILITLNCSAKNQKSFKDSVKIFQKGIFVFGGGSGAFNFNHDEYITYSIALTAQRGIFDYYIGGSLNYPQDGPFNHGFAGICAGVRSFIPSKDKRYNAFGQFDFNYFPATVFFPDLYNPGGEYKNVYFYTPTISFGISRHITKHLELVISYGLGLTFTTGAELTSINEEKFIGAFGYKF
jgi:hypothetical protein